MGMIEGGLTVLSDGATVAGGLSVLDTGVVVGSGGLTVMKGSIAVSDGNVDVTGNIDYAGALTHLSDVRLKKDVVQLSDSLAKLSKVRGVYFSWVQNDESGLRFDGHRHEVQQVLPEVITTFNKKYLSVDYPALIPLVIEAVNELATKVGANNPLDTLSGEIATLRQQLANMQQKYDERLAGFLEQEDTSLRKLLDRLQNDMTSLRKQHEVMERTMETTVAKGQKQFSSVFSTQGQLVSKIKEISGEVSILRIKMDESEKDAKTGVETHKKTDRMMRSIEAEVERLTRSVFG